MNRESLQLFCITLFETLYPNFCNVIEEEKKEDSEFLIVVEVDNGENTWSEIIERELLVVEEEVVEEEVVEEEEVVVDEEVVEEEALDTLVEEQEVTKNDLCNCTKRIAFFLRSKLTKRD